MTKAALARQLGVPASYINIYLKVQSLLEENNMDINELFNKKGASFDSIPKGSIAQDTVAENDPFYSQPIPGVDDMVQNFNRSLHPQTSAPASAEEAANDFWDEELEASLC